MFEVTVQNKRVTDSKPYTVQVSENHSCKTIEEAEAHVLAAQPYVEVVRAAPAALIPSEHPEAAAVAAETAAHGTT